MKTIFFKLLVVAISLCLLSFGAFADPNSVKVRSYTVNNVTPGDKDPLTGNLIKIPIDAAGSPLAIRLVLERNTPFFNSGGQIQTDEAYYAFYVATLGSPPALYALPPSRLTADGTSYTSNVTTTGVWQTEFGKPNMQLLTLNIGVILPSNSNGTNLQGIPHLFAVVIDPGSGFSSSSVISRSAGMGLEYIVPGNPFIASISPDNPSVYSYVTIRGSAFTNTDIVAFYDANTGGPPITRAIGPDLVIVSSTELRVRIPIGTIPVNTPSMLRRMMVFTTTNGYVRSSNIITLNITAAISPSSPPLLISVYQNFNTTVAAEQGWFVRTNSTIDFNLYSGLYLTVNGVKAVIKRFEYRLDGALISFNEPVGVLKPYGPYTGPVVLHTSVGDSNPVYFAIQCVPCANGDAICGGGNVKWGDVPRMLLGRSLADGPEACNGFSGDEHEWVQWQYSYSNDWNDWHDINGNATGRHFQPWACYGTTYYRRKSTHINYNWVNRREEWYLSGSATTIPYVTINSGLYQIRNRYTGQVLEVGAGTGGASIYANGTYVNQWGYNGTANQQWNIVPTSDGMYKILNRSSGQALEIGGSTDSPQQMPFAGDKKQQWLFQPSTSQGFYNITSANNGYVLEIPSGNTQQGARAGQWKANVNDAWSQWELIPVSVPTSARFPGVYTIENVNSHLLLEIGGTALNNGATANQWPFAGPASQQWTFVDAGNGLFNIINRNSGSALEIGNWDTSAGAVAQQWTNLNGTNQQWRIEEVSPGTYKFTNYNSGQALEIGGYSTANGATANQWPYYAGPSQHWILKVVSQNRMAAPAKSTPSQQAKGTDTSNASNSHKSKVSPTLSLYPNPASTVLNLALSSGTDITSVKVVDLRGAIVSQASYQGNGQVDISTLAAGVYFITVGDGQHECHTKFIKR